MRARRICCLTNLGMTPLISSEPVMGWESRPFPRQHDSPKRKRWNERVTGRKARGPQEVGGSKLQVEDFFFLLCWWNQFCRRLTVFYFFFLFSNLGLIMAQQTNIHVNCFMAWGDTPCTILSQKCILWERGLVKLPQPWGASLIWLSFLTDIKHLAKN